MRGRLRRGRPHHVQMDWLRNSIKEMSGELMELQREEDLDRRNVEEDLYNRRMSI